MLSREYRLVENQRINQIKQQGQAYRGPLVVLVKSKSQQDTSRFAVSTSRRIGNAVTRNRIRRLIREAIRKRLADVRGGWDLVVIARHGAREATFQNIDQAVGELLVRAGLLTECGPAPRNGIARG